MSKFYCWCNDPPMIPENMFQDITLHQEPHKPTIEKEKGKINSCSLI